MDCRDVRDNLHDLVDGELDGSALESIRRHLAACSDCARARDGLSSLKRLVQQKLEKPAPHPSLRAQIVQELCEAASLRAGRFRRRAALVAGLAALAAIGLGLTLVWPESRLGHAEASEAFAGAFRDVLSSVRSTTCGPQGWQRKLLREIRAQTGVQLDHVPEVPNARYLHWQVQTVRDLRTIRMDFSPQEDARDAAGDRLGAGGLISVYFLPLDRMQLDQDHLRELEEGHPCTDCIDMQDGSVYCYRSASFLLTVVSTLSEETLVARHRPR